MWLPSRSPARGRHPKDSELVSSNRLLNSAHQLKDPDNKPILHLKEENKNLKIWVEIVDRDLLLKSYGPSECSFV